MLAPWKESYDRPRQHIKKQRLHFTDKHPYSQSYGFSSSHVQMCMCAKSLQCCSTLCYPMDCSPPGSNYSWVSAGKTTGVGCHALQELFPMQGSDPCPLKLLHCRWIISCWATGEVHMDVRAGHKRRLNDEELMLLKCVARENSWESLRLQGDQISQS